MGWAQVGGGRVEFDLYYRREDCMLQVAVYTFLEELTGSRAPSDQAKALACQAAEHQFAGLPFLWGCLTRAREKDKLRGPRFFSLSLKLLHADVSVRVIETQTQHAEQREEGIRETEIIAVGFGRCEFQRNKKTSSSHFCSTGLSECYFRNG